ncbi:hypothetical protein GCM10011332_32930 [Terasakiella brassicae]|uniref:Uncharacterized protein n=1 Tax=Terasakiella brassicae TaxID=1634917 RepID=A0A917FG82_9PROT|nr:MULTISPECIES: hypothetical protein [Terasakiella]GGF76367.1 hypothetical protein GCM10011332_32930 [Terasakiella brassicae]
MDPINTFDIQGQDTAAIEHVQNISVSEDELLEQAEQENIDFVAAQCMDDDIAEAATLLQNLQADIDEIENNYETLRILQLAYSIHLQSKKKPDEFKIKCDMVKAKARADAKDGVIVFNLLEKVSGTQWAKQNKTRWAKGLRLGAQQNISIEDFSDYLESLGGWSAAAKFYDKSISEDTKAERDEKKRDNSHRIATLEKEVPVIAQLPENGDAPVCSGTAGLGLLVYREGVHGEDGILCRLNITADDVESLIHKHRGNLSNGQVDDILATLSAEEAADNV